nr:transposase [Frigidibacter albus]
MQDLIAAQLKVVQIARPKKSCRRCERMVQMPAPSRPIPDSMAGAGLLAHILVSKFDDQLPLYSQHEIFARMGADIPTARWSIGVTAPCRCWRRCPQLCRRPPDGNRHPCLHPRLRRQDAGRRP